VVLLHWVDEAGRCSCGDPACVTPGKHLRNRCATRDPEVLREWWRGRPRSNLGLPTGPENGIVVLDVDPADGGAASLRSLLRRHGPLPRTVEARTGGGGRHLYFRHPGTTVPSRNGWRPGLDVRGDGGYVVASPSLHRSGRRYAWVRPPGSAPLADLPPAYLGLLSLNDLRP
jgi:hypothetical protein